MSRKSRKRKANVISNDDQIDPPNKKRKVDQQTKPPPNPQDISRMRYHLKLIKNNAFKLVNGIKILIKFDIPKDD